MTANRIVLAAIPAALLLAACGSIQAPPRQPVAAPQPTITAPSIPATRADRVMCRRFLGQQQGARGANRFMAWATFGGGRRTANRSANRLVDATVKWFSDAHQSWGDPTDSASDWTAVLELCSGIGVSG